MLQLLFMIVCKAHECLQDGGYGRTVMRKIECAVSIATQSFGSGGGIYVRSYHISLFQDKKLYIDGHLHLNHLSLTLIKH